MFFQKKNFEKKFEKTKYFFYKSKLYNELKINKKMFFDKTQNHDVDYFTETEKYHSGNGLKIIFFIQT